MAFHTDDLLQQADPGLWSRPRGSRTLVRAEPTHSREASADALDLLPEAVITLDPRDGSILATNRAADALLAGGEGLGREADRLVVQGSHLLDRAMRRVREGELEQQVVQLARPTGRPAFQVTIATRPADPKPADGCGPGPRVVLFVHDPDRPRLPSARWFARHYKLTRMESEVARDLAAGRSLQEIAKGRFISVQTVRGHLKQVFSKTGTHRQGELVARLLTGPGSLAPLEG